MIDMLHIVCPFDDLVVQLASNRYCGTTNDTAFLVNDGSSCW